MLLIIIVLIVSMFTVLRNVCNLKYFYLAAIGCIVILIRKRQNFVLKYTRECLERNELFFTKCVLHCMFLKSVMFCPNVHRN